MVQGASDRSAQMRATRGANTRPELMVRHALHAAGLRYRLHDRRLPGRPDIVLPSRRVVVDVRGCFWHQHADPACPTRKTPASSQDYWLPKLAANVARDARNEAALRAAGWTVEVAWECDLRRPGFLAALVERVRSVPRKVCRRRGSQALP